MKINRYMRVSLAILSGGIVFSIICAVITGIMMMLNPDLSQGLNSDMDGGKLILGSMLSGFLIGVYAMTVIMAIAGITHWFCCHKNKFCKSHE